MKYSDHRVDNQNRQKTQAQEGLRILKKEMIG